MRKRSFKKGIVLVLVSSLVLGGMPGAGVRAAGRKPAKSVVDTSRKKASPDVSALPDDESVLSADGYTLTIDGVDYPVGGVSGVEDEYFTYGKNKLPKSMRNQLKKVSSAKNKKASDTPSNTGIYDTVLKKGESRYGYNQLSEAQKAIYDQMLQEAEAFAKSDMDCDTYIQQKKITEVPASDHPIGRIAVNASASGSITQEELLQIRYTFERDNPQFYWLQKDARSYRYQNGVPAYFYMLCEDGYVTDASRDAVDEAIMAGMQDFSLAVHDAGEDVYAQIKAIHDTIVNRVDYSYLADGNTPSDTVEAHSIIGYFNDSIKRVVCEGYSKVFQFVTDSFGIKSVYVVGYSKKTGTNTYDGGHAWNLVSPDDGKTYYYLDATWDDNNSEKAKMGPMKYTWYLIPKSAFCSEHFSNVYYAPGKTILDDNVGWSYTLPTSIGNSALGSDGDKSYFHTYSGYFTSSNNSEANTLPTLNSYLKNAPESTWMQALFQVPSTIGIGFWETVTIVIFRRSIWEKIMVGTGSSVRCSRSR